MYEILTLRPAWLIPLLACACIFLAVTFWQSSITSPTKKGHEKSDKKGSDKKLKLYDTEEPYAKITVGDGKGQKLKALLDTGSNHLWVVDSQAQTAVKGKFTAFDIKKASSFSTQNTPIFEKFNNGEIKGYVGKDKVTIKLKSDPIVIEDQELGLVTSHSEVLTNNIFTKYDAILGLNLVSQEAIPGEPETFLKKMSTKRKPMPNFGIFIRKGKKSKSTLVLGDDDKNYVTGKFNTHSVVQVDGQYNGWNVQIDKFVVKSGGNKGKEFLNSENKFGQIMSRIPAALVGPADKIKELNEEIFSHAEFPYDKNDYHFQCDENTILNIFIDLPVLTIVIENTEYVLSPPSYIYVQPEKNTCKSNLIGADMQHFQLGRSFMEKYYTKFDYENKKVLFAPANR